MLMIPEPLLYMSQVMFGLVLEKENYPHFTDEETKAEMSDASPRCHN